MATLEERAAELSRMYGREVTPVWITARDSHIAETLHDVARCLWLDAVHYADPLDEQTILMLLVIERIASSPSVRVYEMSPEASDMIHGLGGFNSLDAGEIGTREIN